MPQAHLYNYGLYVAVYTIMARPTPHTHSALQHKAALAPSQCRHLLQMLRILGPNPKGVAVLGGRLRGRWRRQQNALMEALLFDAARHEPSVNRAPWLGLAAVRALDTIAASAAILHVAECVQIDRARVCCTRCPHLWGCRQGIGVVVSMPVVRTRQSLCPESCVPAPLSAVDRGLKSRPQASSTHRF